MEYEDQRWFMVVPGLCEVCRGEDEKEGNQASSQDGQAQEGSPGVADGHCDE